MDERKTFIEILTIIGYQKDKEKFTDEFISVCVDTAFKEMAEYLPSEKKLEIDEKIKTSLTFEELIKNLKKYINPEVLKITIETTTARLFQDYITTIIPTLDEDRRKKLLDYLGTLK